MTRQIVLLFAAGTLLACSEEPAGTAQTAAPAPQAAPQTQSISTSAPQADSAPTAQPQRMTQEEREATLAGRRFQEGAHFTRITPEQPKMDTEGDMIEVVEVFQFSCPACFNFEPHLSAWEQGKAGYVNLVRVPAPWNPLSELHARAFYAAEALGIEDESHEAFFNEFHRNRNYMQSEGELADFYSQYGVDEDTFVSTMNSFAVGVKINRAKDLISRYRVNGTPGIVVDGKYTVTGQQAGSYENWFAIIDELAAVEWAATGE